MTSNNSQFYQTSANQIGSAIIASGQDINSLPKLFQPLQLKSIKLANRIVLSPMCMFGSLNGYLTDFHLIHYGQFVMNGVGLVITEATAVSADGRISPNCAGIYLDGHIACHKRLVDAIHGLGGKIGIQLAHAGRKASTQPPFTKAPRDFARVEEGGWTNVVGPSDLVWDTKGYIKPKALTHPEIKEIVEGFKEGARRANEAGYDILELHGAHGYLIHSFLSPISNNRNDEYGGEFENRIRFLLEIIEGVLLVWPCNKPLFIRLTSTDWMDDKGGWNLEETVKLAHILKSKGVDLIDASSGGSSPNQKIKVEPYYQVPFSQKIKDNVDILTGTVGLITNARIANEILEEGKADLIYIGRELLKNPGFIKQSAVKEFNLKIQWPQNYNYIQGKI